MIGTKKGRSFFEPAILTNIKVDMRFTTEIFSHVVVIFTFENDNDIDIANKGIFMLAL